ncbi:MAG: ATP-binding protein [Hyphomicrobiaceae bacterium]
MIHNDLKAALNTLSDPVLLIDDRRRIKFLNSAAETRFGPNLEGNDFVHALRSPEALVCIERVLAGSASSETVIQSSLPVRTTLRMSVVRPESSLPLDYQAVVNITDISHVIEAEQMRRDFVANVSHELRSPLTSMTGIIETLKDAAQDDEAARQKFLKIMSREAGRMKRLIDDLLSLSKVEARAHLRPDGQVDVERLIEQVVATLTSRTEVNPPKIRLEVSGKIPVVPGDADELTQVFHNLIENAVKYGTENGVVRVKVSIVENAPGFREPTVSVSIRDQGAGIAPQYIPRLTERFYRIDEGRSRKKGGTGLGLAIVKHIVNHHLGRLHIQSKVGVGSEFTVHLPVS